MLHLSYIERLPKTLIFREQFCSQTRHVLHGSNALVAITAMCELKILECDFLVALDIGSTLMFWLEFLATFWSADMYCFPPKLSNLPCFPSRYTSRFIWGRFIIAAGRNMLQSRWGNSTFQIHNVWDFLTKQFSHRWIDREGS